LSKFATNVTLNHILWRNPHCTLWR